MIIEICECCGATFDSKYWGMGSIKHNNYTNDQNMGIFVSEFNRANKREKYKLFLKSLALDHHHENKYVGLEIIECRIKWLLKKGHKEIARYLKKTIKEKGENEIEELFAPRN